MRVFEGQTADQCWQAAVQDLHLEGSAWSPQSSRNGPTRELIHAGFQIRNPAERWVVSRSPSINPAFALAEVLWILAGRNDTAFLTFFNRRYPEYVGASETCHGAYGHRLRTHFVVDQLERAYRALLNNPDSRQVVLGFWDPRLDLPDDRGDPADADIPCNLCSCVKVRGDYLEWMQVIRSSDLFLGVPHNFVQFTFLQEILAGWLKISSGQYLQISDSLHVYEHDLTATQATERCTCPPTTESLAVDKVDYERIFPLVLDAADSMVSRSKPLSATDVKNIDVPEPWANILAILAAEAARRHNDLHEAAHIINVCSNPTYRFLWDQWMNRVNSQK